MDRRKFIQMGAYLYATAPLIACKTGGELGKSEILQSASNSRLRVRPSVFSEEGANMLVVYEQVVAEMKKYDESDDRIAISEKIILGGVQENFVEDSDVGKWTSWLGQAVVHLKYCPHGNWYFLPWHRAYLFYFEQICRDVAAGLSERKVADKYYENFAVPYWDWTHEKNLPKIFFRSGSALNVSEDKTIGRIRPWPRLLKSGDENAVSKRQAQVFGKESVSPLYDIVNFFDFASYPAQGIRDNARGGQGFLEGSPHNMGHNAVGGIMGSMLSPYDPIFWTHHCNVDRIWSQWMMERLNRKDTSIALPSDLQEKDLRFLAKDYFTGPSKSGSASPMEGFFGLSGQTESISVEDTIGLHFVYNINYEDSGTKDHEIDFVDAFSKSNANPAQLNLSDSIATVSSLPLSVSKSQNVLSFSLSTETTSSDVRRQNAAIQQKLRSYLAVASRNSYKHDIKLHVSGILPPFDSEPGFEGVMNDKNRSIYLSFELRMLGGQRRELGKVSFFGQEHLLRRKHSSHAHHAKGLNVSFDIKNDVLKHGQKLFGNEKSSLYITVYDLKGNLVRNVDPSVFRGVELGLDFTTFV